MIYHPYLIPDRIDKNELLDRDEIALNDAAKSFDDLRKINRFLGGVGVYNKTLFRLLRVYPPSQHISMLDVGTGSGDMSGEVLKRCRSQRMNITLTGLDVQPKFLQLAKRRHTGTNGFNLIVSDAFTMPFNDNSFDVVISNLVLHHYYDRAGELLEEMYRITRHAIVINDLLRHTIPLLFFKLYSPFFVKSPITRYDGEVSIRRAFSFSEIQRLLEGSNFTDYSFVRHWSFRFGLVIWKKRW